MDEVINDIMQSVHSTWGPIIGHRFRSLRLFSLRASSPIWASEVSLASKLSYLGKRSEPSETRFTRPNRRACSQARGFWIYSAALLSRIMKNEAYTDGLCHKKRIKLFQFSLTGEKTLKKSLERDMFGRAGCELCDRKHIYTSAWCNRSINRIIIISITECMLLP